MKKGYFCEYCPGYGRKIMSKKEAEEHEKVCVWKPDNKNCITCRLHGTVFYTTLDDDTKVAFETSGTSCTAGHIGPEAQRISNCKFYEEKER